MLAPMLAPMLALMFALMLALMLALVLALMFSAFLSAPKEWGSSRADVFPFRQLCRKWTGLLQCGAAIGQCISADRGLLLIQWLPAAYFCHSTPSFLVSQSAHRRTRAELFLLLLQLSSNLTSVFIAASVSIMSSPSSVSTDTAWDSPVHLTGDDGDIEANGFIIPRSEKDWQPFQPRIADLYVKQKKKLSEVMELMKEEMRLDAS